MTDTERLDALAALIKPGDNFDDLQRDEKWAGGGWLWYDWKGHPAHRGWTAAKSLREAIDRLIETRQHKPNFSTPPEQTSASNPSVNG